VTNALPVRLTVPLRECAAVFAVALGWALLVRPGPLSLPYFWDEADVYAPGARWLADHDLDPTPGHFPDDWSRGHPPLLYFVTALLFRLLGPGPAVGHALIVPFTALAIAATYVLGAERGGRVVGAAAALLLATSPLFLSMGAFLLPEMPLTALTVLALVLASRGHRWGAAACGVALVWMKETGVGPPIAIAVGTAFASWREGTLHAARRPILVALTPVLALAAFFVWQRMTAGYFVFPHHQNLFADRPFALANAITVFPSTFLWHGRWVVTGAAVVAALVLALRRAWPKTLAPDATNVAIVVLFLGNAVFFAKMFWLERYALPVHPGVLVVMALAIVEAGKLAPERVRPLALAPVLAASALGLASLTTPGEAAEHTFAFADVVASHRDAYARIAEGGDPLIVTTWPLTTELREPWLGYGEAPLRSEHPDDLGSRVPDVVLVDPESHRRDELRALASEHGLSLRERVEHGAAPPLEIWAR
jgi:4-amino-4-deoxy-L-arabinose transferase-like glycosyltransferase